MGDYWNNLVVFQNNFWSHCARRRPRVSAEAPFSSVDPMCLCRVRSDSFWLGLASRKNCGRCLVGRCVTVCTFWGKQSAPTWPLQSSAVGKAVWFGLSRAAAALQCSRIFVSQGPMLWFLKYFRRKIWRKYCFFLLKTTASFWKIWS
jgi:hypothetical protein